MKIFSGKNVLLALFIFFLPLFSLQAKYSEEELQTIAILASNILLKQHYVHLEPDPTNSRRFFNEYIDRLDPQKMFFTQEDLRKWEGVSGTLFQKIIAGNFEFAMIPCLLFRERLHDYQTFASRLNFTKKDFKGSETYCFDRSKAERPADRKAMYQLWKSKIKNDVLSMMLLDRIRKEDEKRPEKMTSKDKKGKKEFVSSWEKLNPNDRIRKRIGQLVKAADEMEKIDILETYINALASLYDPHTSYLSPRTEEDFNIQMRLSLCGIGAVLTNEDGYTTIVQIMGEGPAEKDGRLQPGDRIIAVQQENAEAVDVIDMPLNQVVAMIRGKPDTKLTLTVLPKSKGANASPVQITLVRSKVMLKESEVSGEVKEHVGNGTVQRIGVITVPAFYFDFEAMISGEKNYKSSSGDFIRIFKKLSEKKKLDALIVDLRSNGGGSLYEAIALSGLFIKDGPVVQIRGSDGSVEIKNDEDSSVLYSGPLVVMINRYSASASEIFAAAMKDYNRAVIVGDSKSHGKGSVQTMRSLQEYISFLGRKFKAGSIKLTCSKFYRINGESTQKKGISPDIAFPSFTDVLEVGEDKLKNPLPWDTMKSASYESGKEGISRFLPILRKASSERQKKDPEFQLLVKDIEFYRKTRNTKEVSLNYEKRWNEYLRDKNLLDEQEKLLKLETSAQKDKNKKKDLYLQETLNIASDLVFLCRRQTGKK